MNVHRFPKASYPLKRFKKGGTMTHLAIAASFCGLTVEFTKTTTQILNM